MMHKYQPCQGATMAIDDRDERDGGGPGAGAPLAPPPAEQSAIRGAFLARQAQGAAPGGGEAEIGATTLRGAYLSRLTRETRVQSVAVVGSEETGGAVLRSIYAARTVTVETVAPAPARRARSGASRRMKAAPAKKARPAKAAPKRRKARVAAARPAKRKKTAPVRRAKTAARKIRRRR
jgi:hypothetical protein